MKHGNEQELNVRNAYEYTSTNMQDYIRYIHYEYTE